MPCRCHHCHFSQGNVHRGLTEAKLAKPFGCQGTRRIWSSWPVHRYSCESAKLWDISSFCVIFIHCLVPGITNHSNLQKLLPHLASLRWDFSCFQQPFSPSPAFPFFPAPPPRAPTEGLSCVCLPLLYTCSCQSQPSIMSLLYKCLPSLLFYSFLFPPLTSKPMFNSLMELPASQSTKNPGNQQRGATPGGQGRCTWDGRNPQAELT